jgi:hypothetical protein
MTQLMSRLVPGRPVRLGHRGIRSTASVLRKPVAFESARERDFHILLASDPSRESATVTVAVLVVPSQAEWSNQRSHHRRPSIGKPSMGYISPTRLPIRGRQPVGTLDVRSVL